VKASLERDLLFSSKKRRMKE
jgi:hypothetical protein